MRGLEELKRNRCLESEEQICEARARGGCQVQMMMDSCAKPPSLDLILEVKGSQRSCLQREEHEEIGT